MAREPTILCAGGCGKLIYDNSSPLKGGLPPGQATCQDCRRSKSTRKRICRGCGKEFRPPRPRRGKVPFCSKACLDKNRRYVDNKSSERKQATINSELIVAPTSEGTP